MALKVLLTGSPGCGKTTLIKRTLAEFRGPAGGFYTREIRRVQERVGFEIVTLDGFSSILASVDKKSSIRVGKYGVNLGNLENTGVPAIQSAIDNNWLVVIDEIGPMEIKSPVFREMVLKAFDNDLKVLASIVKRSTPFTDAIKNKPGTMLFEVREDNREELLETVLQLL